jgi:DNA-binding IscR family transcriptional regulator
MNGETQYHKIRGMDAGSWFWVSKKVIREYASKLGFLPIAVYHFLASMADDSQSCYPSQRYVAEKLGCSRSSVSRALKTLTAHDLIRLSTGANMGRVYQLLEVRSCIGTTEVSHPCKSDVAPMDTNNTTLTRINNNDVVRVSSEKLATERPLTKKELLASDIAETLGDERDDHNYLSLVHRYPESVLREALSQVKQTPPERIRKSRAALFIYLVSRHAK